jgi:hypothetical protein
VRTLNKRPSALGLLRSPLRLHEDRQTKLKRRIFNSTNFAERSQTRAQNNVEHVWQTSLYARLKLVKHFGTTCSTVGIHFGALT